MIKNRDNKGRIAGGIKLYDWCIENNRKDILERWDYELNSNTPHDISFSTAKEFYFKCPIGLHESAKYRISYITRTQKFICIKCNSFAQRGINLYGENFLNIFWDYENNDCDPWLLPSNSNQLVSLISLNNGNVYTLKPCAFWAIKDIYNYAGRNEIKKLGSLGDNYKESLLYWSDANFVTPYDYAVSSHYNVIWKCPDNKHEDYIRNVRDSVSYEFRCPKCTFERTESLIQEKVRIYLSDELGYILNHEEECSIVPINPLTGRKLPFDNEVIVLKLIIEVHGSQHYNPVSWFRSEAKRKNISVDEEFEYQKWKDRYKKDYAIKNGYYYLDIPYWNINNSEYYKKLITNKINEIEQSEVA